MINPTEYWDKIAEVRGAITPGDQWNAQLVCDIVDSLTDWIPEEVLKKSVLLDVGCGEGRLMVELARKVDKYVGVDISGNILKVADEIRECNNLNNVELIKLENEMFYGPNFFDRFDVVVSFTVFMHLPTEVFIRYLSNIRKYMKHDGYFAFQLAGPDYFKDQSNAEDFKKNRFDMVSDDNRFETRWYPDYLIASYLITTGFCIVSIPTTNVGIWKCRKYRDG